MKQLSCLKSIVKAVTGHVGQHHFKILEKDPQSTNTVVEREEGCDRFH